MSDTTENIHPLAKWMDEHGTEQVPSSLIGVMCETIAAGPTENLKLISKLRYTGSLLRQELKVSATLCPENWNLEAVMQLLAQWDEAATEAVKLEMKCLTES